MQKIVKPLLTGLKTVFKHLFMKKVTLLYPEIKNQNKNTRGLLYCDKNKCIGCSICKKVCPSLNVITIENKKVKSIDAGKCIFCKNCVYECPTGAMNMTNVYELATESKKSLLLEVKNESNQEICPKVG